MTRQKQAAQALDGVKLEGPKRTDDLVCDNCSKRVEDGEQITVYVTTVDYTEDRPTHQTPFPCRVYCHECDRGSLKLPLQVAEEFLIAGDMVREGTPTFENTICIDYSAHGAGVNWDPQRVFKEFTGINLSDNLKKNRTENFGPEDVLDLLEIGGLDATDHINDDGNITMSKSKRLEVRDEVHEQLVEELT